ncbi:MAG: STAS domain-containing protein [Bryobacteraceae bacterium]|jgi:anti-anti-sigma factor
MMEISHSEVEPATVVIKLAGKLMLGREGDRIVSLVEDLIGQGKRLFIFDLAEVGAIDSTGIGRFISSFNKILAAGGEMRMAGARAHVFQSFHVSLLDKVFRFYPNVDAAL